MDLIFPAQLTLLPPTAQKSAWVNSSWSVAASLCAPSPHSASSPPFIATLDSWQSTSEAQCPALTDSKLSIGLTSQISYFPFFLPLQLPGASGFWVLLWTSDLSLSSFLHHLHGSVSWLWPFLSANSSTLGWREFTGNHSLHLSSSSLTPSFQPLLGPDSVSRPMSCGEGLLPPTPFHLRVHRNLPSLPIAAGSNPDSPQDLSRIN